MIKIVSDLGNLFEDKIDYSTIDEANTHTICDIIHKGNFNSIHAKSTPSPLALSVKEFVL